MVGTAWCSNIYAGQPLLRQPKQSGSAVANFHYGARWTRTWWVTSAVMIWMWSRTTGRPRLLNPGFVNAGLNVNYRVRGNLTLYVNLRNALDRHYEEIYGFPSPLLNVVAA